MRFGGFCLILIGVLFIFQIMFIVNINKIFTDLLKGNIKTQSVINKPDGTSETIQDNSQIYRSQQELESLKEKLLKTSFLQIGLFILAGGSIMIDGFRRNENIGTERINKFWQ